MTKPEPTEDILEAFMRAKRKTNTSQKEPSAVTAGQETNEKPGTKIKKRETDHSQEKQFAAIAEQETDAAQSTTARKRTKGLPLEKTEAKKQKRGEQITSFNEILDFLTNKERAIAYINSIDPSALLQAGSQEFLNNYYSDSGEASEKLLAILQAFKESNPPQHFLSAINYQRVSPLNILFLIKSLPEVLNNGDKPSGIARSLCGLISSLRTIESFNPETPEFVNEIYKSGVFEEICRMQHDKGMLTREHYGWLKEIFYNEETKAWDTKNLNTFATMMNSFVMFDQEEYISLKGNPKFYENGV